MKNLMGAPSGNTNEIQGLANKCTEGDMTKLVNSMNDFFGSVMLVSHCGEYPCECKNIHSRQIRQIMANIWRMGLRMQFATNRNDRKMIARYS